MITNDAGLNMRAFLYLFFRLAPFILVSFFSLASLFNQDVKGIFYLLGVIVASFSIVGVANILPSTFDLDENRPEICNAMAFSDSADIKLSMGQGIIGFTFCYLLYGILKLSLVIPNIPTILFFVILIAYNTYWNITNNCYGIMSLGLSVGIGGAVGYLWAYLIDVVLKLNKSLYFTGVPNDQICSKPSKSTFRCNVYKNGKLIQKM